MTLGLLLMLEPRDQLTQPSRTALCRTAESLGNLYKTPQMGCWNSAHLLLLIVDTLKHLIRSQKDYQTVNYFVENSDLFWIRIEKKTSGPQACERCQC